MKARFFPAVALAMAAVLSGGSPVTAAPPPQTVLRGFQLWTPPLGSPLSIAVPYSLPNGPYRAGHRGVDFVANAGEVVHAPTGGAVSFVGYVVDRPVLSIRVDAHTVVSFEPIESDLLEGDSVARGGVIGEVGAVEEAASVDAAREPGAHCRAGCLHVGVRVDGEYVNPLRFLRPKPVLLPW